MRVVIDTNVVMAALLKEAIVRQTLLSPKFEFYLPEDAFAELEKYGDDLCEKAGFSESELEDALAYLLGHIHFVKRETAKAYLERAEAIMKVDAKDALFIAAALAIKADGIWSFDKHFKQQSVVKVFDIQELALLR